MSTLPFEEKIAELETKVTELRYLSRGDGIDLATEVADLERAIAKELARVYRSLSPWQRVLVSRHPSRPQFSDYAQTLLSQRFRLRGDRLFGEDPAIVVELGRFAGMSCVWSGHDKGGDNVDERVIHNFGMAKPEGYRKFQRSLELASRFDLPVVTLVNTPGAFPGIDAEARGQAEAIARSIDACLGLTAPLISVIVGEGGSGGAIAMATADVVLMLEYSVYSVISPEGCSAILWRDTGQMDKAAEAMRLTAPDLKQAGVIDEIIEEPLGGAHRNPAEAIRLVGEAVDKALHQVLLIPVQERLEARRQRFLRIGAP